MAAYANKGLQGREPERVFYTLLSDKHNVSYVLHSNLYTNFILLLMSVLVM